MTEEEFLQRWRDEQPMYEAWGGFVARTVTDRVRPLVAPVSTDLFIRIPVRPRLKSDGSFLTKAFYRSEKSYRDPYEEITDKVGVRFVLLLLRDIQAVSDAIEASPDWDWSKDRDYEEEKAKAPLAFDYQSVHYVVRCRGERTLGEVVVAADTPCEVQVRTLLQHAHSELTHDTIYKPSVVQTPAMKRAAAKSMALIETTGDYFQQLVDQIAQAVGPNRKLTEELMGLYRDLIGREADPTRAEGLLSEGFAPLAGDGAVGAVRAFVAEKPFVVERIKERAVSRLLFRQPSILLVYLVVSKRRTAAEEAWPLTEAELKPVLTDLGIAGPA
jgi:putative GTP pyrophosphokinase